MRSSLLGEVRNCGGGTFVLAELLKLEAKVVGRIYRREGLGRMVRLVVWMHRGRADGGRSMASPPPPRDESPPDQEIGQEVIKGGAQLLEVVLSLLGQSGRVEAPHC
jgi:hypothetical protein